MLKMKEVLDYVPSMDTVANDFIQHLSSRQSDNHEIKDLDKELFKWAMECKIYSVETRINTSMDIIDKAQFCTQKRNSVNFQILNFQENC